MKKTLKTILALLVTAAVISAVVAIPVSAVSYPESQHDYDDDIDSVWDYVYSDTSVESLNITFSGDTYVETGYDYI